MIRALLLALVGAALVGGLVYDVRQRRHGIRVRDGAELDHESLHNRVDLNALPYEPARRAGQRDWATYRARDRRRRGDR